MFVADNGEHVDDAIVIGPVIVTVIVNGPVAVAVAVAVHVNGNATVIVIAPVIAPRSGLYSTAGLSSGLPPHRGCANAPIVKGEAITITVAFTFTARASVSLELLQRAAVHALRCAAPRTRLNARLKANSDWYPTRSAIWATDSAPSARKRAASVIRQRVRRSGRS